MHSWDDMHRTCGRFGVMLRLHGNGLIFEDVERGIRVKASSVGRELSKPRLCKRLGDFQPASSQHFEAARRTEHQYSPMPPRVPQSLWKDYAQSLDQARMQRQHAWSSYRDSASVERRRFKEKYRHQRSLLAALPVSVRDRKRLLKQLALRQAIDARTLRRKLAAQRKAVQKTPHPGSWRHFVASCAANHDARAIRLLRGPERQRGSQDLDRCL